MRYFFPSHGDPAPCQAKANAISAGAVGLTTNLIMANARGPEQAQTADGKESSLFFAWPLVLG